MMHLYQSVLVNCIFMPINTCTVHNAKYQRIESKLRSIRHRSNYPYQLSIFLSHEVIRLFQGRNPPVRLVVHKCNKLHNIDKMWICCTAHCTTRCTTDRSKCNLVINEYIPKIFCSSLRWQTSYLIICQRQNISTSEKITVTHKIAKCRLNFIVSKLAYSYLLQANRKQ